MGSTPNILGGQPSRTSIDLDVWGPESDFDREDLENAVRAAGLEFDPKGEIEPGVAYVQIVQPGISQLGAFEPQPIETRGNLALFKPPPATLIAAKLIRAQPKDLQDITWLLAENLVATKDVESVIDQFPSTQREVAKENLVYLKVLKPKSSRPTKPRKRKQPSEDHTH